MALTVLTPAATKGPEFDTVIVVEPKAILAHPAHGALRPPKRAVQRSNRPPAQGSSWPSLPTSVLSAVLVPVRGLPISIMTTVPIPIPAPWVCRGKWG